MYLIIQHKERTIGQIYNAPINLKHISNLLDELALFQQEPSETFVNSYNFLCNEYEKIIEKKLKLKNVVVLGFKQSKDKGIEVVEVDFL